MHALAYLLILSGCLGRGETLTDCVASLVANLPRIVKASVFSGNASLLAGVVERLRVPVTINAVESVNTERSDLVLVMDDAKTASALKRVAWYRETVFLVLRRDGDPIADFEVLWRERAVNGFVAIEEGDAVNVYGYEPYETGSCNIPRVISLGRCHGGVVGFGARRITNVNGCEVNVTVLNSPPMVTPTGSHDVEGFEGEYLKVIARVLNFRGRYRVPPDGKRWGSVNPPTGLVGQLMLRVSDFGVGLLRPASDRHRYIDLSRPILETECVTFYVPAGAGRDRVHWLTNMVGQFTTTEWVLILASVVLVTIVLTVHHPPMSAFMYVFSSLLGQSLPPPPNPILKCLASLWIVISLVLTTIYQGSWGSKITVPLGSPEIETFRQLLESNLALIVHPNVFDAIAHVTDNPTLAELGRRFVPLTTTQSVAMDRMIRAKDAAVTSPTSMFTYTTLKNPEARGKIWHLTECLYDYTPVVGLQKNSPFTPTVDAVLLRLSESGIGRYWRSQVLWDVPTPSRGLTPVNLRRSVGVFVVLMSGLAFASTVFFCELWFGSGNRVNFPGRLQRR